MRIPHGLVLPAVVLALAAAVTGCSSGQEKAARGSLAIRLAASRHPAAYRPGEGPADDPVSRLQAASVSISGIEARRRDGTWVPVECDFPTAVDLLALANVGDTVTLPAVLVPEGPWAALQVRFNQVELTLANGARMTIPPRGAGWVVVVPVDFGVVTDRATTVGLNIRLDRSFRLAAGAFDFDPDVEIDGVERR